MYVFFCGGVGAGEKLGCRIGKWGRRGGDSQCPDLKGIFSLVGRWRGGGGDGGDSVTTKYCIHRLFFNFRLWCLYVNKRLLPSHTSLTYFPHILPSRTSLTYFPHVLPSHTSYSAYFISYLRLSLNLQHDPTPASPFLLVLFRKIGERGIKKGSLQGILLLSTSPRDSCKNLWGENTGKNRKPKARKLRFSLFL